MALFSKENFTREGAKNNLKKFAAGAKTALKKRWWVMLIELAALAIMLLADLLSKKYVVPFLLNKPGHTYALMPGFIHLTYSENTGAGFGMLSGNTTLLIVVTFIVIIGLTLFLIFAQKQNEWLRASLLLIVGGGIGNLVDRLGLGYVRDFIEYAFLKNFAICNVADVFVTVGAVMLIIVLIVMLVKEGRKNQKEFEKEQAGKAPEQAQDPLDAPVNLNPMLSSPNDYKFEETASAPESDKFANANESSDNSANASEASDGAANAGSETSGEKVKSDNSSNKSENHDKGAIASAIDNESAEASESNDESADDPANNIKDADGTDSAEEK